MSCTESMHDDAFVTTVVSPATHVVHERSLVSEPVPLTNLPGWQSVHGVQLDAFEIVLKLPLAQPAQL